jgi:predicted ATPase/DNA-binding SARP family transcriptional activator
MATGSDLAITCAVLGTIAVTSGGRRQAVGGRQRLLLAHLLVERGRVVPSDRLVDTLWGDDLPSDPAAALRSQVARLRRLLPAGAVSWSAGGYRLDLDRSQLDATRFEDLVAAALDADPHTAAGLLADALALWHGPAFEPVADRDFAQPESVRLDEMRLTAVERLGEVLLMTGDAPAAVTGLVPLVGEHPEREHARALLMEALYRDGRHTDALGLYRDWCEQLSARGLEPTPYLRSLEHRILTHEVAPTTLERRQRSRLPRPVTTFVGRDAELVRVVDLVMESRLVNLCGPGGVGKTRLALEAAVRLADAGEVVHYCDLAAVGRGAHVIRAVAMATEAERHGTRPSLDEIVAQLAERQVVLVLDNCEHVIDATARLTHRLLHHTDAVRVLATSREPLMVGGERIVSVAPLPVGDGSPAVELFLDRAQVADPDVDLGQDGLADVARLCARVDGLPLAIELAAGRLRTMTARELADALGQGFDLLDGGSRAIPRHRSLRSVIDWSYAQLDDGSRRTFEALSVFAGGFDLAGAAAVAVPNGEAVAQAASAVARLVDSSLLAVRRGGDTTTYRMLATLRSYAQERLAATGLAHEVRHRHAAWALSLAEASARGLRGRDEARWVQTVRQHFDDLRAAHEWLVGADVEGALALSAALHPFAMWRGHREVFEWAETAVAAAAGTRPPSLAAVLGSAAVGRAQRGELDSAEAAAIAGLRAASEPSQAWVAREAIADVKLLRGETCEAADLYLRCHADAAAAGDAPQAVWSLGSAAVAHLYGGRPDDAGEIAAATVREAQQSQNPSAIAFAEFVLGEIGTSTAGEDAENHLQRAIALASSCDSHFVEGLARVTLATLRAGTSDIPDALDHYASAIHQWRRHNTWAPQWVTLRHLVDLLARNGAATQAATLYGAVISSRTGAPPYGSDAALLDHVHGRITAEIGETAFARESERGSTLSGDDVIATALQAIDDLRSSIASSPPS